MRLMSTFLKVYYNKYEILGNMKILLVVAHPDDEILGAGASIAKWTEIGEEVGVCIMSTEARARASRPRDEELSNDMHTALDVVGVKKIYEGIFPNIEMNTVPHIELVKFIETAIIDFEPDRIVTHHPSDLNNDHMHTSMACQEAIRLFQRRKEIKALSEVWFMETLSCTEWTVNSALNRFAPNTYVEIGQSGVEKKIRALGAYRGVMRDFPHPRSNEAIRGLAAYRGAQAGCNYAEAFESVLR